MLRDLLLLLALGLAAAPAVADEGELLVAASAGFDAAWLRNPLLTEPTWTVEALAPAAAMPRARIEALECLTNELGLGLGLDVRGVPNITTRGDFRGRPGTVVTGGYLGIGLPLAVSWGIDVRLPLTFKVELDAAPGVALWSGNALVNVAVLDKQHRPQRLPVDLADVWQPGLDLTVCAAAVWRIGDQLLVSAGPGLGVAWYGTADVHAGLVITAAWIPPPLGP